MKSLVTPFIAAFALALCAAVSPARAAVEACSFATLSSPNDAGCPSVQVATVGKPEAKMPPQSVVADTATVASPVPEPKIVVLMLAGIGLIGFMARRRK
jgi:cell division septation protein DedD